MVAGTCTRRHTIGLNPLSQTRNCRTVGVVSGVRVPSERNGERRLDRRGGIKMAGLDENHRPPYRIHPRDGTATQILMVPKSGAFAGVGRPGEGLAIDYQVIVEIRGFEVAVGGGDRARVAFFVKVLNDRNGVVRASRTFEAEALVSGSGNAAYVDALDRAFGDTASQVVVWVASAV